MCCSRNGYLDDIKYKAVPMLSSVICGSGIHVKYHDLINMKIFVNMFMKFVDM